MRTQQGSFRFPDLLPQSLRTYLLLFAMAITLPLLGLAVVALHEMASTAEAQIEQRVMQAAQEQASDIDRELNRAIAILETLATSPALRDDLKSFHAQARLALRGSKSAIVLIDRSYQQHVDTLTEYGAALPQTADPETARKAFETLRPQISNLFKGSISGRYVFNVVVPVRTGGDDVRFALIMSFQAAHIADLLREAKLEPPWISGVTDHNGIVVARTQGHEEYVGRRLPESLLQQSRVATGSYRTVSIEGRPIVRATVRSELSGWLVSATVPVAHVEEPYRRSTLFSAALLGLALLLGGGLAYLTGTFMARSLDVATRAAASLGRGEEVHQSHTALAEADTLLQTLAGASRDLRRGREHADLLLRELAHRAKNQLAVVSGMAQQTARRRGSVEEFMAVFTRRLEGLARSQDVLVSQSWKGASMRALVLAHLDLIGAEDRVQLDGPDLYLDSAAVQNVGFALLELGTNAAKYGALSIPNGRVTIRWTGPVAGNIHLYWHEQGGPAVVAPTKQGFGLRVITELVPRSLGGMCVIDFLPEGVHWHLSFSATHASNNTNPG